jgi:hypothetical protein
MWSRLCALACCPAQTALLCGDSRRRAGVGSVLILRRLLILSQRCRRFSRGPAIESILARAMTDYTGTPIPTDQAWRTFGDWKSSEREIGVIFYGGSGTSLYTMGFVESARNGKLLLKSDTVRASFNLTQANFTYGPVQTWPKWPSPPIVEVIAVQA